MKPRIFTMVICVVISLNLTAQNPGCYPASAREYQVSSSIDEIGMVFVAPGILLTGTGGIFNVSHVLRFIGDMSYFGDDPDKAAKISEV